MSKTAIPDSCLTADSFPLLKELSLSEEEVDALRRQGFIRSEQRGNKTIYRLRYRVHGRQRVRYISPGVVAALEVELAVLQKRVRARRRLARVAVLARAALDARRATLAPHVEARGYYFHGYQTRRRRSVR